MRVFTLDESRLPLRGAFQIVGRHVRVATNDQVLLDILRSICASESQDGPRLTLRVFVGVGGSPANDDPPYFRGLHHLVFAKFGPADLFVFDIAARTIRAVVTRELAHDRYFWQERLLPIVVGVFGASIGVLPLHAACLSLHGKGLLIAGASGTGKSTLSLAMAKKGANLISDDWTYVTYDGGELRAHGLSTPIKLLPDAANYFPELRQHELRISLNGELAYELPGERLRLRVEGECDPDCLVFYERVLTGEPDLIRLSGNDARAYIQSSIEPLPIQLSWITEQRQRLASRVAELPCWRFRHSGVPDVAAQALLTLFAPKEPRMSA